MISVNPDCPISQSTSTTEPNHTGASLQYLDLEEEPAKIVYLVSGRPGKGVGHASRFLAIFELLKEYVSNFKTPLALEVFAGPVALRHISQNLGSMPPGLSLSLTLLQYTSSATSPASSGGDEGAHGLLRSFSTFNDWSAGSGSAIK